MIPYTISIKMEMYIWKNMHQTIIVDSNMMDTIT